MNKLHEQAAAMAEDMTLGWFGPDPLTPLSAEKEAELAALVGAVVRGWLGDGDDEPREPITQADIDDFRFATTAAVYRRLRAGVSESAIRQEYSGLFRDAAMYRRRAH